MTTATDIANQALGMARARTQQITQSGPEATQINLNYNDVRDQLLRAHFWNFAKATVSLGAAVKTSTGAIPWTSAQPPPPWVYEYTFPSDCIAIRAVFGQPVVSPSNPPIFPDGQDQQTPNNYGLYYDWEIANDSGLVVLTNAPTAIAVITSRITDPDVWDIDFKQAMTTALAAQIAIPLSGDLKLASALTQQANALLMQARVRAANEATDQQDIVPDWLRARWSEMCGEALSVGSVIYG